MGILQISSPDLPIWKFFLCIILVITVIPLPGSCTEEHESPDQKAGVSNPVSAHSASSFQEYLNVEEYPDSFYEIRFISPELLDTILSNSNPEDEVLKIGPGMTIGISTPHILYLRTDLQSDEYLLKNREMTDLKEEITQHLLYITFGRDNANVTLLKKDLKYMIWFDAVYTKEDITNSLQFARLFNNLSSTAQFEDETVMTGDLMDNYEVKPNNYFNIKITSKQFLEEYRKDKYQSSTEEILKDKKGNLIGILSDTYVYLWDGLSVNERKYLIIKSLLWGIGLHGETSTHPDSFFYKKADSEVSLSNLDMEVIKLLYGGRLSSGMTPDQIRKALDISAGAGGSQTQ
ncbi:MAG: hypothetical protein CVV33_08535 [Methanomicrobiales archaeon HGW-Methanomicrobiales-4]|nr:MAG: hypothetical protein CVV33_08535 [Methanomicrobiales archaeon HGW-Methanomicrobiales-4]